MSEPAASRRIYLDVCALCRPFDDPRQARVRLEAEAVGLILGHVRAGRLELTVSPAHAVEIAATTDVEERVALERILAELGRRPEFEVQVVRRRAEALTAAGLGPADAAHLAFADAAGASFVTVDDRFLRRARRAALSIWVGTPMAYCEKEDLR